MFSLQGSCKIASRCLPENAFSLEILKVAFSHSPKISNCFARKKIRETVLINVSCTALIEYQIGVISHVYITPGLPNSLTTQVFDLCESVQICRIFADICRYVQICRIFADLYRYVQIRKKTGALRITINTPQRCQRNNKNV